MPNISKLCNVFGKIIIIISFWVISYSATLALPPGHTSARIQDPNPDPERVMDTRTMINVNNLQMFCTNIGGFAEDISISLETGKADGLYYPAGSFNTVMYSGGVWIGGTVNDEIRTAIGAFDSPEYWPGPADDDGGVLPDNPSYKIYKIWGDSTVWHNEVKTGIEMADGTPYTRFDSTRHYGDYLLWPEADGAPVDGEGNPVLIGDQMLWAVFNDGGTHTYDGYGGATDSLGVEVQATYWGYDLPGALGNTIFMKFIFINKSPDVIDSCYVSLWADPDLGGASDDLVGCDTTLSLGYCYNATNNDNAYGSSPPAVGYDFMQGPIIRESDNDPLYATYDFSADTAFLNTGDTIPQAFIMGMTSFNKYINGTDPDEPEESYGYMKGNDSKGGAGGDPDTPPTNPQTLEQTKFYHAGDPVKGTGWLDTNPADRRYMVNTGPFTFNPDDTQIVIAAVIVGHGTDRLSSITSLKTYSQIAQSAYDLNFSPSHPYIELDHVDGLADDGKMIAGEEISLYLRVINNIVNHSCIDNCFNISSPDGAEWNSTSAEFMPVGMDEYFEDYLGIDEYDVDGHGIDKIGFRGVSLISGLPVGFNEVAYKITIGPIDDTFIGKTIELDSCSPWIWCQDIVPDWNGPYIFEIVEAPICGDINLDKEVNISDITYLIDYYFYGGPEPILTTASDLNCDGLISLTDIVILNAHLFHGGVAECCQ